MAEGTIEQDQSKPAGWDWRVWLEKLRQPGLPQLGLMIAGAATLALVVAVVLWSSSPSYDVLYRGLSDADAGEIVEALQQGEIPFKIDPRTGALTVPASKVHEARLKLASQGLRGAVNGFELLDQQSGFGVSQFMENARYQRALEGELARSIISIGAVQNARVHLALPKETVFVRNRQPPSASVLVQLHPGRVLDKGQVAAIVHLVSSSIPKLSADQVSVIDQTGNLLTRPGADAELALSLDQLEYGHRLEERYIRRIEDILTPILGMGRVRAQVALEVDFTAAEETAELYEPGQPPGMMRSERLLEELNARPQAAGIPGALSNQPPGVATVPEEVEGQETEAANAQTDNARPQRQRKETTRNYELDKRISHTRRAPGQIQRISTAVVVDDRSSLDQEGNPTRTPLTPEELERITALVKEAVGFDAERGDTVNVINATFAASPFAENPSWWQQDWFLPVVQWLVIGAVAVLVIMMVVRPAMRHLLPALESPDKLEGLNGPVAEGEIVTADENELEGLLEDRVELSNNQDNSRLGSSLEQLELRIKTAKTLVAEDPKRAVQVIKHWIGNEA